MATSIQAKPVLCQSFGAIKKKLSRKSSLSQNPSNFLSQLNIHVYLHFLDFALAVTYL